MHHGITNNRSSFKSGCGFNISYWKNGNTLLTDPIISINWILSNNRMEIKGHKLATSLIMPLFFHPFTSNHCLEYLLWQTAHPICFYYQICQVWLRLIFSQVAALWLVFFVILRFLFVCLFFGEVFCFVFLIKTFLFSLNDKGFSCLCKNKSWCFCIFFQMCSIQTLIDELIWKGKKFDCLV